MRILSEGNVFREFKGIATSIRYDIVDLYFDDDSYLRVTEDHKVFVDGGYKESRDLVIGDVCITSFGKKELIYKCKSKDPIVVYDPVEIEDTHNFFANDTLVHQCVYLDEFAHVQNDVEFFTATYPVISSGDTTKVIITSTPNGMNLFYKMWTEAQSGKSMFVPKQFLWHRHPKRGEKWKQETLSNISQKQFDQEYECFFHGSSNTLISGSKLAQLTFKEPIEIRKDLDIYELPEPEGSYVLTVDVSEGIGKDNSAISVFKVSSQPYKQVAVFKNDTTSPLLLAGIVNDIGKIYNNGYVIIETNNVGKITADCLYYDYEYENVLLGSVEDKENVVSNSSNATVGIRTTRKTKSLGCSTLKSMIESDTLIVEDFTTINELSTFVKVGSSYEAEKNKYDDIVMTLVIFCWFAAQPYFEDITNINMRAYIKENFARMEDSCHTIYGFFDDGTKDESDELNDDMLALIKS